ncbi:MAG TPA: LysM peptidoglycan-binding domain-containing protein, partial [Ilumatobacteraceae bacterium]
MLFGVALSALSLSTLALPAPAFAAPAAAGNGTYVVVAGDFLAGIAAKLGVALPQLLAVNNLKAKSVIVPGDKLIVPAGGVLPTATPSAAAPTAGALTHTVKSGEFLGGIANQHKVTLADLLAVNKLT